MKKENTSKGQKQNKICQVGSRGEIMIKNRYKHKIISVVLSLIFIFGVINVGNAYSLDHRLEQLNINVYINKDGSARITEKRIANLVEGTENYIVIDNLGKSKIKDFTVYENGQSFKYVDNWNVNASRGEKVGKNGIITTSSGYELAWGIGEYGRHDYTLEYTVTNFVKQLQDSQMLFWQFVNSDTNIPPQQVTILIESENQFSEVDEKIWAFGFDGNIAFEEGKIIATSSGPLSSSNYVTILTRLPQGMFVTQDIIDKGFDEIKETAFAGSDYNDAYDNVDNQDSGGKDKSVFSSLFNIISRMGFGLFIVAFFMGIFGSKSKFKSMTPTKFKRSYKEEYYRDYPYVGDFLDIYYIPYMMGAVNFEKLLTGFILKWINEDRIITVEEEVGWILKKDETNIKFLNTNMSQDTLEGQLFNMMLVAAGKNEILEEKEFTKWARSNITKIDSWEKRAKDSSKEKLVKLGYLDEFEKKVLFFKTKDYKMTEKGTELQTNIYKYINYLYDFSLLNEHEAVNVKIWDNIMVWAGFLGLTEVVMKQFEKLYPKYTQETVYRGNSIFLTSHLARNISQARVAATRSSGGGGGSSMGGGGGSFGGGSGGGTR